ncbi:MAG: lipopolysaccharide heptosyltransferase family protein, partial [Planctomycetota bacterium]|nr:lipopolysaccharide heptosyltransferase family protein [Planctomycetota bacterium]
MIKNSAILAPAPRILLVRLSALGDIVHGLPVLCALRAQWPEAFLAWAVESPWAAILHGHSALDEILPLPRGWLASPAAIWRWQQRLRKYKFTIVIDMQGLTKSAFLGWLAGAKERIGFGGENSREISRWFYTLTVKPTATHIVEQNLELLRPLGIAWSEVRFDLPRCAE